MTEAIATFSTLSYIESNTPNLTNLVNDRNLQVLQDSGLPNARNGLRFINAVPAGTIIDIYENATGGKRITLAWIVNEAHKS